MSGIIEASAKVTALLGDVLDQLVDEVIAVDEALRVTYLNAAARERYRVSLAQVAGRPVQELHQWRWLGPDDEAAARAALEPPGGPGVWRGETLRVMPDGRESHVESTVTVLRDAAGARHGFVAVIRDVEARKRAERRSGLLARLGTVITLRRSPRALMQTVLPLLVEAFGVDVACYAEFTPDEGPAVVLEEHRAAGPSTLGEHRVSDYLSAEAWRELLHWEALVIADVTTDPRTAAHLGALGKLGIGAMVNVPLLRPDPRGTRSVVSVLSSRPRAWDADELALLRETAAILTPALERGRAEEALRRSEERFRKVFENAPTGISITGVEGGLLQCNAAFAKLVGYSQAELHERVFDTLIHPEDRPQNLALVRRLLDGEVPFFEVENRYVHRDGHAVWVHKYISLLRDDAGRPTSFVALVTDMTLRRQAEESLRRARDELDARVHERTAELQQRADQLSRLASDLTLADQRARKQLAQVLHDHLQQLLASAKMRVEVLARGPPDPAAAIAHVLRCLEEAIATSRSLSVELSPPLLHEFGLAAGLEWLAEWMHEKHGLVVSLDVDPAANPESEDVRTLVFESVRELLFNAVKHADVREAEVTLSVEDQERCSVTVSDRGRGYDPESLLTTDLARVGMGLFNVRERLALLGGSMQVDSEPGRGTAIILVVPRRQRGERD